ncbi:Aste57867_13996 [Aphanomyces stellatus]|uniref:Aste57867_13996 protein n=1 Tax=Aphanomyces stellatus TaxID=120398 RepID=A0A485KZJ0_9STRA|nr:hypothetical protein As57867_013945 [Aphanomyces stellatus]VFT90826.1 Aste57867_13996 [Aphanomyces stellatus]
MQQGMREMRLWRPILCIYGRLHIDCKRETGTKTLDELPALMASRQAILGPWLDNPDDRARLYDLATTDQQALADVAEYAAFYGLVDVLQTIHDGAAAKRTLFTFCVLNHARALYQLAAFHAHAPIAEYLRSVQYYSTHAGGGWTYYSDLEIAVERGHLEYVDFLWNTNPADVVYPCDHDVTYSEGSRLSVLDAASASGHLELVRFLHGRNVECTTYALDQAATNGHLDVVRFLVEHCKRCTTDAMDGAAANGHFNIVQFLQAKRTEGCTSNAMDDAAFHGHTDIVRFLHSFYPDEGGCTVEVMNAYASRGDLAMVEWLDVHRLEKCSPRALNGAASGGHLAVVQYLIQHKLAKYSAPAIQGAVEGGFLDVVQYLHTLKPGVCVAKWMQRAHKANHEAVVEYFDSHRCKCCQHASTESLVNVKPPTAKKSRRKY